MHVQPATDAQAWESFLTNRPDALFLQSWTMGEVYRDIGQEPVRLEIRNDSGAISGICQAIVVPARRGRHLMVQYGPVLEDPAALSPLLDTLKDIARDHHCSFLRISPFWPESQIPNPKSQIPDSLPSPLHLLSEYTWYIPLRQIDPWAELRTSESMHQRINDYAAPVTEESILKNMRKTTRNLIGRAQREGVTVVASSHPSADLNIYFRLQKETTHRHGFVPYRDSFIRAQVAHFAPKGQAIVYIARYKDEPVAASVHMSYASITSYHHGASTHKYAKIPASYLLQWTAIREALHRGDCVYNFWGIAPPSHESRVLSDEQPLKTHRSGHPFAGVTTFKTGFGGKPLPLMHCRDVPLSRTYRFTRAFETVRKWKRGF